MVRWLVLLLCILVCGVLLAADTSGVDWTRGEVRATGIGLPPAWATGTQARLLAREAAVVIAERNLAKVIYGVQVTGDTTVRRLVLEDDAIRAHVSGLVTGALPVSERALDDGSYEVTLAVNLYGAQSVATGIDLPARVADRAMPTESPVLPYAPAVAPTVSAYPTATPSTDYTGLLIDCRGLPFAPSLAPRILDQRGQDLWGALSVSRDLVNQRGIAGYYPSTDAALRDGRVGAHPLIVTPMRVTGGKEFGTSVVLSPADIEQIQTADAATHFLDRLAIGFLVDE